MKADMKQRIERGRQAFERRDYVAALSEFQAVLEANPGFADIRHRAGLCLSFLGETRAALKEFDRALEANDRYLEAHLHRAITLNELGRYDEAKEAFAEVEALEAKAPGRFPAAVSARLANAHADVGDLYLEAGAPSEAIDEYGKAVRLRPEFVDIRTKRARALLHVGKLDEAEEALGYALDRNDRFIEARLCLGLVHYRRGDADGAVAAWERCLEQDPENPQARAYLAMLDTAPHESGGGA